MQRPSNTREYIVECKRLLLMWSFYAVQADIEIDVILYDVIKTVGENKFANIYVTIMSKVANRKLIDLSLVKDKEKFTEKHMTVAECFDFMPYRCSRSHHTELCQASCLGKIEFIKFIFGLGNFIFSDILVESFINDRIECILSDQWSPFRLLYEFIESNVEMTYWAFERDSNSHVRETHISITKDSFLNWPELDSIPEVIKQQICRINSNSLRTIQLEIPIEASTVIENQQLEALTEVHAHETSAPIENTNGNYLQIFLTCVIAFLGLSAAAYLLLGNFLFNKILPFCACKFANYIFTGITGAISIFLIVTSIIRTYNTSKLSNEITNSNCVWRFFGPHEKRDTQEPNAEQIQTIQSFS